MYELTQSQLERVRGFSLETHAIFKLYRPLGMPPPLWVSSCKLPRILEPANRRAACRSCQRHPQGSRPTIFPATSQSRQTTISWRQSERLTDVSIRPFNSRRSSYKSFLSETRPVICDINANGTGIDYHMEDATKERTEEIEDQKKTEISSPCCKIDGAELSDP